MNEWRVTSVIAKIFSLKYNCKTSIYRAVHAGTFSLSRIVPIWFYYMLDFKKLIYYTRILDLSLHF